MSMDANPQDSSLILLPAAWRIPSQDWRRIAVRRPKRKSLVATRKIIDQMIQDEGCPALDRVARGPISLVLGFLNCCPDLTFAIAVEDCSGFHVRCSRDLLAVGRLVRSALDPEMAIRSAASPGSDESPRIAKRRERTDAAVSDLAATLEEREDLTVVLATQVAGSSDVDIARSFGTSPEQVRLRLRWFARHVLELQTDCPTSAPRQEASA